MPGVGCVLRSSSEQGTYRDIKGEGHYGTRQPGLWQRQDCVHQAPSPGLTADLARAQGVFIAFLEDVSAFGSTQVGEKQATTSAYSKCPGRTEGSTARKEFIFQKQTIFDSSTTEFCTVP